jgi:hypothetical protein
MEGDTTVPLATRHDQHHSGKLATEVHMDRLYGKYRAQVLDRDDPERLGRLLVRSAVLGDGPVAGTSWSTACVAPGPVALPEVGATVWIEFEEGDKSRPLWTGCAWQSAAPAPPVGPGVTVDESGGVHITSTSVIELTAPAVRVNAPMLQGTGIVECATLIATTGVVSPSYTPGAGNVL